MLYARGALWRFVAPCGALWRLVALCANKYSRIHLQERWWTSHTHGILWLMLRILAAYNDSSFFCGTPWLSALLLLPSCSRIFWVYGRPWKASDLLDPLASGKVGLTSSLVVQDSSAAKTRVKWCQMNSIWTLESYSCVPAIFMGYTTNRY